MGAPLAFKGGHVTMPPVITLLTLLGILNQWRSHAYVKKSDTYHWKAS